MWFVSYILGGDPERERIRERAGKEQGEIHRETKKEGKEEEKETQLLSKWKRAESKVKQGWRVVGPQVRPRPSFWFLILGGSTLQRVFTKYPPYAL